MSRSTRRDARGPRASLAAVVVIVGLIALMRDSGTTSTGGSARVGGGIPFLSSLRAMVSWESSARDGRVAIIGAAGFIGSRLYARISRDPAYSVTGYDRSPRELTFPILPQSSSQISDEELRSFETVIYLGGCTGRVMCDAEGNDGARKENVEDILSLAKRMDKGQLLVFASTSALGEGYGPNCTSEDAPVKADTFDTYTRSMHQREITLRELASSRGGDAPQMVGLRFGTVVGVSQSQRTFLVLTSLVCSALTSARLRVAHPETYRGILHMDDLVNAVHTLIAHRNAAQEFEIFHLQSFWGSVGSFAAEVAAQTGAIIDAAEHAEGKDVQGFSLSAAKFSSRFGFRFGMSLHSAVANLIDHAPDLCVDRDVLHHRTHQHTSDPVLPCVVCGSKDMMQVLDLGSQPLANDFRESTSASEACPRFPLQLMRCQRCHHMQLSYGVDRDVLFRNYLYASGTSKTLSDYFVWLADKVAGESGHPNGGTVLELACNDGTQLDKFKAKGWKTFGVDPARNIAELGRTRGHTVHVGFWGVDAFPTSQEPSLPFPNPAELDAIVAQNVLAHVLDPIRFLRACVAAMGPTTKLYIQTSQCEMLATGQFDTVYHEHVSFFTAHSFVYAARRVGLVVVHFELTPIHGTSCLVTFMRGDGGGKNLRAGRTTTEVDHQPVDDATMLEALKQEEDSGATSNFYYISYRQRALEMRGWTHQQLASLASQGFEIVGFGAAAKGVVLLHFLRVIQDTAYTIRFVVDEAPLKQGRFIPGTDIPVKPSSSLLSDIPADKPIAILVLPWNFLDEIVQKIGALLSPSQPRRAVLAIVPFPTARIINISPGAPVASAIVLSNPHRTLSWPHPFPVDRKRVLLISHFFNEELLLPYFIRHHAGMFDAAILIDYNSTDKSVDIIKQHAPQSWRVVTTVNSAFDADVVDNEVMDYEALYPGWWKIALTTTEFLLHDDLRGMLATIPASDTPRALRFKAFMMAGDDSLPLQRLPSLAKQRSAYSLDLKPLNNYDSAKGLIQYSRYIHDSNSRLYEIGRHSIFIPWEWSEKGTVMKFKWTPWPQVLERKTQIKDKLSARSVNRGWGVQHQVAAEKLVEEHDDRVARFPLHDLAAAYVQTLPSPPLPITPQEQAAAEDWYTFTRGTVKFVVHPPP